MYAVVTGAAGFIGAHLCEHLLRSGDEVVGIDSFSDHYGPQQKEENVARLSGWGSFSLIRADLAEGVDSGWVRDADVVYHLAAESGHRPSWGDGFPDYVQSNILATWRLLQAAREAPLRKFVYASCASVYGAASRKRITESARLQPLSAVGVSKAAGETLCDAYRRTWDVPTLSLRLFSVYGTRQRPDSALARLLTAATSRQPFLLYGDGTQTRDLVHVDDVVTILRSAALSSRTGVVNVGTGSPVSLQHLIGAVGGLVRPVDVVRLPDQPGAARHLTADITLARRWFGYTPRVSLADGLSELTGTPGTSGRSPHLGVAVIHPVGDSPEPGRP